MFFLKLRKRAIPTILLRTPPKASERNHTKVSTFSNIAKIKTKIKKIARKYFSVQQRAGKEKPSLTQKLIDIAQSKDRSPLRSLTPVPRTLNAVNRKREFLRINEEKSLIGLQVDPLYSVIN